MKRRRIAVFLVCGLCWNGRAAAQSCTLASTAMAFGTYQQVVGPLLTTMATITVTCNPGVVSVLVGYSVDAGLGGGGTTFATRRMSGSGANRLPYQLYLDSNYSQVFGNGTGGTYHITDGYLLGVILPITRTYTVYGRVPVGQAVQPDSYTDGVIALLTY